MKIIFRKYERPLLYEVINNAMIEAIASYSAIYEMPIQLQNLGEVAFEDKNPIGYGIELIFPEWFPKGEIDTILTFIKSFNGEVIPDGTIIISTNNRYGES